MPSKYTQKYTQQEIDELLGSDSETSTMAGPEGGEPTVGKSKQTFHPRTHSLSLRQAASIAEAAAAKTTITDMALVTESFSKPGVTTDKGDHYSTKLFGATEPDESVLNPASASIAQMVPRFYFKFAPGAKHMYENLMAACSTSYYPKGRQHQNLKRKRSGGLENPNKDLFPYMKDSIQPTRENFVQLEKDLYNSIGKEKLDKIVPWSDEEEGITWSTAILDTKCILAMLFHMHPDSKIVDHPSFTSGNNGAKIEHSIVCLLTNFTAVFMYKLLKGPTAMWKGRQAKLSDYSNDPDYITYIKPVMKWAVNACNPCPDKTVTMTDILHKHLYHFNKTAFEKCNNFGCYSNSFILEKIKASLGSSVHPVDLTPDMVKGVFFPHAIWLTMLVPKFHNKLLGANKNHLEETEKTHLSSVLKQSYF